MKLSRRNWPIFYGVFITWTMTDWTPDECWWMCQISGCWLGLWYIAECCMLTGWWEAYLEASFLSSVARMASRNSIVCRNMPSLTFLMPWMQPARSLVSLPDSTVSMHASSSRVANLDIRTWLENPLTDTVNLIV